MIPSRRLRSCLRCRNVSKDELREGISWMGEVHLFHRSFIVEMKREGIERVVSRRDIFGLSPSEGWFFYILIPRGTCSWHVCTIFEEDIFENKIFTNNNFKRMKTDITHKE